MQRKQRCPGRSGLISSAGDVQMCRRPGLCLARLPGQQPALRVLLGFLCWAPFERRCQLPHEHLAAEHAYFLHERIALQLSPAKDLSVWVRVACWACFECTMLKVCKDGRSAPALPL